MRDVADLQLCTNSIIFFCSDDDSLLDSPATQNLGEIKLRIWAAEFKRRAKPKDLTDIQLPSNEKIHERSKKATTHHVK